MPEAAVATPPPAFNDQLGQALKDAEAAALAERQTTEKQTAAEKKTPHDREAERQAAEAAKKAAETPDEVDEQIESGKRNPKPEDFKRVRQWAKGEQKKREEYEGKVKTYESELTELKKAPKHNAKLIEELTQERDKYKAIHDQVLVEFSPEFHAKYQARIDSVASQLKAAVGDKADKVFELIQLPDSDSKRKALGELADGMDDFAIGEITLANRDMRVILTDRKGEISKAKESLDTIAKDRQEKATKAAQEHAKHFESVVSRFQDAKEGDPMFQVKDGDTDDVKAWNSQVQERVEVAKAIFSDAFETPAERAQAALDAASKPALLKQLIAQNTEIATLKETVSKMTAANPSLEGSGGERAAKPKGFNEGFEEDMAKFHGKK